MDFQLLKYHITPRVVKVGKKNTISIKGLDDSVRFYDDVEYLVSIFCADSWKYKEGKELYASGRDMGEILSVFPKDGVITFTYSFMAEGEYEVKIERKDKDSDAHVPDRFIKYWKAGKNRIVNGFSFMMYALENDLYGKKPYKGDLHVHSFESDGFESPEFVAARYRTFGYDFMSLTDHYFMDSSFELVNKMQEVDSGLKVFPGEEVHPMRNGEVFHVVNFNGKSSVNALYNSDVNKAKSEINEIAKTIGLSSDVDNLEIAYFKWIFDKIREAGGIAIYPHAFWHVGRSYNVRPFISDYIIRNKLCDAFEILGGMSKRDNREMAQYAAELKADGVDLPFVASSDAHSSLKQGSAHFGDAFTIAFSESLEQIPNAIMNKQAVAVDNFSVDDKTVYGNLRLVRYTYFLLEQYYAMHDELCNATGQALLRYVLGDEKQKTLVETLDNEREKFDLDFFGM